MAVCIQAQRLQWYRNKPRNVKNHLSLETESWPLSPEVIYYVRYYCHSSKVMGQSLEGRNREARA